jgi:hypothetical protein
MKVKVAMPRKPRKKQKSQCFVCWLAKEKVSPQKTAAIEPWYLMKKSSVCKEHLVGVA